MKKTKLKSSMSSSVVHVRWGDRPGAGSQTIAPGKKVMGLDKLDENEKEWANKRAQFHGGTVVSRPCPL